MKYLLILVCLISCNEGSTLKSEQVQVGELKRELKIDFPISEVGTIKIVEDKMFQPPNYSIRVQLRNELSDYEFSAIEQDNKFVFEQRSHLDEIKYFKEPNDIFIKLKDHDEIEANKEFNESFKVYFKKNNVIKVVDLSLNYSLMLHEHNPPESFDKDFHWMGQDKEAILELTTTPEINEENINITYKIRANLAGSLEDIDLMNLEVESIGTFEKCDIERLGQEQSSQSWIVCEGNHTWDFDSGEGVAGNAPMMFVDLIDNQNNKKTVMIMIHFLDPR